MKLILANQFKNESKRLKEWLTYHKFLGIKDFILVNDHSSDDSVSIINSIPDITVHLLNSEFEETAFKSSVDTEKYKGASRVNTIIFHNFIRIHDYCLSTYGRDVYLGFFDVDEFIFFDFKKNTLKDLLDTNIGDQPVVGLTNFDVDSDQFDLDSGWITQQTVRSMSLSNRAKTYRGSTIKSFQNLNYSNLHVFKELLEIDRCNIGSYVHAGGVHEKYIAYADPNQIGFLHYRKPMYSLDQYKNLCDTDYPLVKLISDEALKLM